MKQIYTFLMFIAFMFNVNAQSWVQDANTMEGTNRFGKLGWSTKISKDGSTVVTGVLSLNSPTTKKTGGARVFKKINDEWIQLGSTLYGDSENDHYGFSVAINGDGTVVAVASLQASSSTISKCGAVKIFKYDKTDWVQVGSTIYGDAENDSLGWSVDLNYDGTLVAVSAMMTDISDENINAGSVKVFKIGEELTQVGSTLYGTEKNEYYGSSVSLNSKGDILAVGIRYYDAYDYGATKVYKLNTSENWSQLGNTLVGEGRSDNFGWAVDLNASGTLLVVGATDNDNGGENAGEVKVFKYGSSWTQVGDAIHGDAAKDAFGITVAISSTDTIIVVGSRYNSDSRFEQGKAKVFKYNGSWTQIGQDILGRNKIDWFGQSVDLSGDASIVTVGAPKYDTDKTDEGAAFAFYFTSDVVITNNSESYTNVCLADSLIYGITAVNATSYKWIVSANGIDWNNVEESKNFIGVDTDTMIVVTTESADGLIFKCVASNSTTTDTSDCATVILDIEAPDLDCINDTIIHITNDVYVVDGTKLDPLVTDNCTIDYVTNDMFNTSTLDGKTFVPGDYYINWTAYDMLGNDGTCSEHIEIVSTPTKIKNIKSVETYLYPTTVENEIYVKSNDDINNISIYSVTGKLIKTESTNTKSINLSDLPSGMYIVTVTLKDSSIISQKIIKK